MKTKKEKKISRGYRLKPSTHKLLADIQEKLRTDADTVIHSACIMFFKKIRAHSSLIKIL